MGHRVRGLLEGCHFNPYYDGYCLLPLYALRPGTDAGLADMVAALRERCPRARLIVRGVVGKAEVMAGGDHPRSSVTNLPRAQAFPAQTANGSAPPRSTRTSTARAARWRTCSSNKRSTCPATG